MLWIGGSDAKGLLAEVELRTGLKAKVADAKSESWINEINHFRVIVMASTVPAQTIRKALSAAVSITPPVPVVIFDMEKELDPTLIQPSDRFYHIKNHDLDELADHVWLALEESEMARQELTGAPVAEPWRNLLVGESRAMRELHALIRLVGPRRSTVLITGDTGTGKERVARAIHAASQRSAELVAVNCGALPENLIEAELFGHTKGAFTGATGPRVGRFEQADKGTLFLDEIGEVPLPLQAKLLRVLQEREVQRIGSPETIKLDTRIIAATNSDLLAGVAQKRFREDLYYRLNVVPIRVPTLRERATDIPLLAEHFIEQVCVREDLPAKKLTPDAVRRLTEYEWPGNIRQLEHAIEMAVTLSGNRRNLFMGDIQLPERARAAAASSTDLLDDADVDVPSTGIQFEEVIGRVERLLLDRALKTCNGNKAKAASLLGMKRTTLLYKMKAFEEAGCAA